MEIDILALYVRTNQALSIIREINAIAKGCTPADFLALHLDLFLNYPREVFLEFKARARKREIPAPGFMYGASLMLSYLPPARNDVGYIWLYRGMSKAEAGKIARGDYTDISFYWTPNKHKAAGYAKRGGGVVCAILVPARVIRIENNELNETLIPAFEALPLACRIDFYSTILNKCCNSLIFRRLSRKYFGKYPRSFYIRIAKRKVMQYEI